jgi:hypothetical protein
MFHTLEKLKIHDVEAAALTLPIIFHVGTSADTLTDNTLTLYAQTVKRLNLSDDEVAAMEQLNEDRNLEDLLSRISDRIESQHIRELLFEIALITAASSRLVFVEEHHQCLLCLSDSLGVSYSDKDLAARIKAFRD